jgi:hypothetical protein
MQRKCILKTNTVRFFFSKKIATVRVQPNGPKTQKNGFESKKG